jgi:hypothetical protein
MAHLRNFQVVEIPCKGLAKGQGQLVVVNKALSQDVRPLTMKITLAQPHLLPFGPGLSAGVRP